MSHSLSVRPFRPLEWETYKGLRLRALAESPDAFGSTLANELDRPDAQWAEALGEARRSGSDLPLIAFAGDEPAGVAWAKVDGADASTARLFQMWVAPEHRGQGLGRLLLSTSIQWAKTQGAKSMSLGVTCGDTSAARLYVSAGFEPVDMPRPLRPGSSVQAQDMRLEFHR